MSNIVPMPAGGLAVPTDLLAKYQSQSSMGELADGFSGGRRIQIRGGVINFLGEDGKPMGIVQNADGSMTQFPQMVTTADIVIVQQFPAGRTAYRQWFATEYSGDGEAARVPDCWSADGEKPSPNCANRQADTCKSCPRDVSGSSKTGRGKACQSRKRLAVYLAADPERRLFQLDLPPTAVFGTSSREAEGYYTLANYSKFLKSCNAFWEAAVTQIAFTELSSAGNALLRFKAVSWLDAAGIDAVFAMAQQKETTDLIEVNYRPPSDNAAAASQPTAYDPKAVLMANPSFPAHLREWAQHAGVTVEMIKAEAAKLGIAL